MQPKGYIEIFSKQPCTHLLPTT